MRRDIWVVRSADDLRLLADAAPPARLALDFPDKPACEVAARQARLSAALGACGCIEGTIGLMAALLLALFATLAGWMPGQGPAHVAIGTLLLASLGCVAGKLAGLTRARRAIKAEIEATLRWIEVA